MVDPVIIPTYTSAKSQDTFSPHSGIMTFSFKIALFCVAVVASMFCGTQVKAEPSCRTNNGKQPMYCDLSRNFLMTHDPNEIPNLIAQTMDKCGGGGCAGLDGSVHATGKIGRQTCTLGVNGIWTSSRDRDRVSALMKQIARTPIVQPVPSGCECVAVCRSRNCIGLFAVTEGEQAETNSGSAEYLEQLFLKQIGAQPPTADPDVLLKAHNITIAFPSNGQQQNQSTQVQQASSSGKLFRRGCGDAACCRRLSNRNTKCSFVPATTVTVYQFPQVALIKPSESSAFHAAWSISCGPAGSLGICNWIRAAIPFLGLIPGVGPVLAAFMGIPVNAHFLC
ncbi:hypothetical protein HDU97_008510 [Phlyctochytrium planicorne]|nr:hypothetical protein HDU97_008510 [Phlyctochytrium planicorne]